MDEKLDCVAFNFFIPAINVPFEIGTGKDRSSAAHQCSQKREFASRQAADFVAAAYLEGRWVEADAAIAEDRCRAATLPAQNRSHPRKQFTYGHLEK